MDDFCGRTRGSRLPRPAETPEPSRTGSSLELDLGGARRPVREMRSRNGSRAGVMPVSPLNRRVKYYDPPLNHHLVAGQCSACVWSTGCTEETPDGSAAGDPRSRSVIPSSGRSPTTRTSPPGRPRSIPSRCAPASGATWTRSTSRKGPGQEGRRPVRDRPADLQGGAWTRRKATWPRSRPGSSGWTRPGRGPSGLLRTRGDRPGGVRQDRGRPGGGGGVARAPCRPPWNRPSWTWSTPRSSRPSAAASAGTWSPWAT